MGSIFNKITILRALLAALSLFPASAAQPTLTHFINLGGNRTGFLKASAVTPTGEFYDLVGGGNDTWDIYDELSFQYREYLGDFDVRVQVLSVAPTARWSKAGLMIRESLAEDSRMIFHRVTPPDIPTGNGGNGANDTQLGYRTGNESPYDTNGSPTGPWNGGQHEDNSGTNAPLFPNAWLRLVRQGSVFTAYLGHDGSNWNPLAQQDTATWQNGALDRHVYLGLSVSRHSGPTNTCEVLFTNFSYAADNPFCLAGADSRGCPKKIRLYFNHPVADDAITNALTGIYSITSVSGQFLAVPLLAPTGSSGVYSVRGPFVSGAARGPTPDTVDVDVDSDLGADGGEGGTYAMAVIGPLHDIYGNQLDQSHPCYRATFIHGLGYEARLVHISHNVTLFGSVAGYETSRAYEFGMPAAIDGLPPVFQRPTADPRGFFEDFFNSGTHANYVGRLIGVLSNSQPSGNFVFACASDDEGFLYLSLDDQPVHKQRIAGEPAWANPREYLNPAGGGSGTVSSSQPLTNGGLYYLEYPYHQGGGGHHAAVTWDAGTGVPILNGQAPISQSNFVASRFAFGSIFYHLGPAGMLHGPDDVAAPLGGSALFFVRLDGTPPYTLQWYTNNPAQPSNSPAPVMGATGQSLTISPLREYQANTHVFAVVGNECGASVTSRVATLNVQLNPKLSSLGSQGNCHQFVLDFNKAMNVGSFTPQTVTVLASNSVSVTPVAVGPFSSGANQNEIVVGVSPDLLPDTNIYVVILTGVLSQDGLMIDPNPTVATFVHGQEFTGPFQILWEKYNNSIGVSGPLPISNFLAQPNYVNHQPDAVRSDFAAFETPWSNLDDRYGDELRGYWNVPQDGDYRFWCASDDFSQTFLAADAVPDHKLMICEEPGWANYRAFADAGQGANGGRGIPPVNESPAISLYAGQRVYLQADHTEGVGGDHYSLAYTVVPFGDPDPGPPTNGTPSNLAAAQFAIRRISPNGCAFQNLCDVYFVEPPIDQMNFPGQTATFSVTVDGTPAAATCYYYQWLSNNVIIPDAVSASYTTTPNTPSNDGDVYSVIVNNDFSLAIAAATNYVLPNPIVIAVTTLNTSNQVYIFWNKPVANIGSYYFLHENQIVFGQSYFAGNSNIIVLTTDPIAPGTSRTLAISNEQDLDGHLQAADIILITLTQMPGYFCTDFGAGLPPGTIASGTTPPYVTNGVLHLTDAVNSQANYWTIPLAEVQTFTSLKAHWRQWLGPGTGGISNSADGMSFNVGQDLGTGFTPEEGATDGLSVTVDTYDNGGGEVGLEVRWNGERLSFLPVDGGTLNGPPDLEKNQWVDASVEVTSAGVATFIYDTLVTSAQIPNYSGINANMYVFAARTGGANEFALLSDVCISNTAFNLPLPPVIMTQPVSQALVPSNSVTFTVAAVGALPLSYQWQFNGTNLADNARISGSQSDALVIAPALLGDAGNYQVMVSNPYGAVTSTIASLAIALPLTIVTQPQSQNVLPGTNVIFTVVASGTPPFTYQWRRNGQNVPGATNSILQIFNVQPSDGGTYSVVVENPEGAVTSDPAVLIVNVSGPTTADNFVDRVPLIGPSGVVSGNNTHATLEPGEVSHASKPGGKSVWYTWQAPADGIAWFRTTGSTFDTLLGVYQGTTINNRTEVASDDDSGGFFTSAVRFNVIAGQYYQIAVDGYGGASGNLVLSWGFEATPAQLPKITQQPQSATVGPGTNHIFSVTLLDPRLPYSYQWFFNGVPIPGATDQFLTIPDVQTTEMGLYFVEIGLGGQVISSLPASLQINQTEQGIQPVLAYDKLLDAVISTNVLVLGFPPQTLTAAGKAGRSPRAAGTVVRGYTGSQVFNSFSATTGTEDENYCGVVCGASEWIKFVAEQDGVLYLDTSGSAIAAVIAVYNRVGTNMVQLGCDYAGGPGAAYSMMSVPVQAAVTNFLVVDGVKGATGLLVVNYSLVTPSQLVFLGKTPGGAIHLQVVGRAGMKFSLDASANLSGWSSLITTNSATSTFDFLDATATNVPTRFYRALMLP